MFRIQSNTADKFLQSRPWEAAEGVFQGRMMNWRTPVSDTDMRGYDALVLGWNTGDAEADKRRRSDAEEAFGTEWVTHYERATEDARRVSSGMRMVRQFYGTPGGDATDALDAFRRDFGDSSIRSDGDAWDVFSSRRAPILREAEKRQKELVARIENMREEELRWIGRYLAGQEEMTPEQNAKISGLFSPEEVESITRVREASQAIVDHVRKGERSDKTAGVLEMEDVILAAIINPETGEIDNKRRAFMQMALDGIARSVQDSEREANAVTAGYTSFVTSMRQLITNLQNEDGSEYRSALSRVEELERLANDENYYRSKRMSQERYKELMERRTRDDVIELMYGLPLYDPAERQRIMDVDLPEARREVNEQTSRKIIRGLLQDYVAQADSSPEGTSWYKQVLKGVGSMLADTSPYMIPFVGPATGTVTSLARSTDFNLNANLAAGLSPDAASTRSMQDAVIASSVELLPWSRIGGRGFNATMGKVLRKTGYKPGAFTSMIAEFASRGTAHAALTETVGGVIDEGVLEPLGQGLLTMATDKAMDTLGVAHGESRTFGEAFSELRQVWTDPTQLAALTLFMAGLTGARLPQMRAQSRAFADSMRELAQQEGVWQAMGLSDGDVRRVVQSDNPLQTGRDLFNAALSRDPEAVKKRMARQGARLKEAGFTLKLTGTTGELSQDTEAALAEAYREMVEEGVMPQVERIADQNGEAMFRITERDRHAGDVVQEQELNGAQADTYLQLRMAQADARRVKFNQQTVYEDIAQHVEQLAGTALTQQAETRGAEEGLELANMNKLGEGVGEDVQKTGFLSYAAMKKAAERLGGQWKRMVSAFEQRVKLAGVEAELTGTAAFRAGRSSTPVRLGERNVFGTIINYAQGNVTPLQMMEESVETRADMWLQMRAQELAENSENEAEAHQKALDELAGTVRRAREELLKLEPGLKISSVPENATYMHVIEAMSDMGRARFLASPLMPSWMNEVQDIVGSALDETAEAIRIADAAKRASTQDMPGWKQLEDIFASFDLPLSNIYSTARIDAAVIEQVRSARARMRGTAIATTAAEVIEQQQEAIAQDAAAEQAQQRYQEASSQAEPPQTDGKPESEQTADTLAQQPEAKAPGSMRGVFVRDACVYNAAGGFYIGCVPVRNLRDSKDIQQVKAGAKGAHGVINPITGEFQQETEAIYVWRRKDGALEVISGRHKYALALENGTESVICYVFNEDAQHDAKWARLLDYENNMRGDQADELTAAIYTRETGYDDATLHRKGLMRNKSKSKRGILIGREARAELWDRFINGAVSPMDAEIICNMTRSVRDKARVDEIQRRCCMLLEQGKSWEYISAMVQLMANKESVFMKQGLLDLGVDFEADMARAAIYVETCVKKLTEAINVIKSGRRLSGDKRRLAERLGQYTTSSEASETLLRDLTDMRERYRNIGAYPDLVASASMWDGKTELDPISMARNYAHSELEQAAEEANMTREQWEEAQAAKAAQQAAQEATGSLFSTFSLLHKLDDAYMDALRRGDEETARKLVLEAAKAGGYVADSNYQGSLAFNGRAPEENGYFETERERYNAWKNGEFEGTISLADFVRNGIDPNNLKWQISDEGAYRRASEYARESIDAIREAKGSRSNTITIYRAVPKSVKEKSARNGDWVTLSEAYAKLHISLQDWDGARIIKQTVPMDHVWWDGNDINEWGYDDGKEYAYRNTANNRKSLATVTYDAHRNIIPLSQRFNPRKSSVSFSLTVKPVADCIAELCALDADGKPAKSAYLRNTEWGKDILVEWGKKSPKGYKSGVNHIVDRRMSQGLTLYETAFAVVCALTAAQSVQPTERGNRRHFDRFGIRAVVAENSPTDRPLITGFIITPKYKKGAGETAAPNAGTQPYALNELARTQEVGAALSSALSRFDSIVKQNPSDWEKIIEHEIEMLRIKQESIFDDVFMKAPNGEPTNLTEKQWLTVRTQSFKNWFGDWENDPEHASKVVDENGEPKVVYHGTWEDFTRFKRTFLGQGEVSPARSYVGHWFSEKKMRGVPRHLGVFVNLREPETYYSLEDFDTELGEEEHSSKSKEKKKGAAYVRTLRENAKDGVIVEYDYELGGSSYVVLDSANIKSATDNRGTFDPASPDITFSMVPPQEAQRIAREFNALEKSKGVRISAPGVYVKDTKAAAAYAKERYNALKAEVEGGKPLLMPIAGKQKEIQLPGRGFNEVKHHAADRRNLACLCGLRDLCESAIYINSASDSKQEKPAFKAVVAYHYFAAKGNFKGASAYNADNSDVAYVSIVIAERSNGEFFYDLNATNVEAIDNDKNTSEELPSNRVTNSAMAAPGGVRKGRIHLTKEFVNYINEKNANFATHSLIDITQAARIMMKRREDDMEGEELITRWDNLLQLMETASRDRRDGAARLGALVALLESTRSVLPPEYARLGRLNALMKWAAVYAHLISTGEVKRDGLLKGAIFDMFVTAMQREYEGSLQRGLTEEEARAALQDLGERRMDEALIKVARECRGRLDTFVKARARERIERMAERAYPKKQRGKKSPRGKMDAASYRAMSTMLAWMNAPAEKVAERAQQIRAAIEQMESSDTDRQNNTTRDELEEELRIVQLYGDWAGMSAGQARIAADDFVQFVITHRHGWDEKIQMEKRRRELIRWKMNFRKTSNANTRSRVKREGGIVTTIGRAGKSLLLSAMSYSQLIFAGKKVFGETFTRDRLNDIAHANAALRTARRERDDAFAQSIMDATGLKKESDINKWLNRFSSVEKKTGIFKREVTRHTLEMTRDEAEEWCSMTAQQRTEKRRAIYSEAEASGLAPENIPTESDIARLKEELDAMEARESTARKVRINVIRYGEEIELEASRDAVANAILLLEQEDYQHLIEYEGFTPRDKNGTPINRDLDPDTPLDVEQTLKPLYDYIGKDGRAFAYNLRRYVGENGKHMQAVYEAQQGVPLAMKPFYWRGNFNINTIKEKDTLTENNAAPGNGYGFLIDRVRHYNRLEWTNTATMVFASTVEAQNNYTYTSNITREWRALLSDTNFQKQLEVELGRPYMTILKEWLDIIDGTSKRSASMVYIEKIINFLGRGLSYVALAGNVFVLLKQSSAILNSLMGGEVPRSIIERGNGVNELTWRHIGLAEYIAAMARTRAGLGAISLKELSESEWFQARTDSIHKNIARRMHLAENKKQHTYSNKLADKAMDMIEWTDRAANLIGMQALADAVYRDLDKLNREKNLGLSEDAIKKEALTAVGRALETSAQPNEASQKTLFAARGGIVTNVLFQFRSETMNKLGQLISRIMAGESVWSIRDYMTYGAANAAIAAMIAWVRYGDDDKKRKNETWEPYIRFALNAATGDLSAIPIIGDEIKRATAAITGEPYWEGGIVQNYVDTVGIHRHIVRLSEGRKNRKKMDWHDYIVETNGLIRKAGILTSFLGNGSTLSELVLSAAAAGNIIRSGADIIHGTTGE